MVAEGDFNVFVAASFHEFFYGCALLGVEGESGVSQVMKVEVWEPDRFSRFLPRHVVICLRKWFTRGDWGFKKRRV